MHAIICTLPQYLEIREHGFWRLGSPMGWELIEDYIENKDRLCEVPVVRAHSITDDIAVGIDPVRYLTWSWLE
jgi:hypothetical protein